MKTNITVYVEASLVKLARARKINLSQACNDGLRVALQMPDDIEELQNEIQNTEAELSLKKDRLNNMRKVREDKLMARATEENRMEHAINSIMDNYYMDRKPIKGKDGITYEKSYCIGQTKIKEISNDNDIGYEKLLQWTKTNIAEYNEKESTQIKAKITPFHPEGVRETDKKAGVNPI